MFDEGMFALGMEFGDVGGGGGTRISISSTFGPTSLGGRRPPVDMILLSNDSVVFYVDEATLFQASNNSFKGLLPLTTEEKLQRILFTRDIGSSELDIMLQAVYNVPSPTTPAVADIDVLVSAVDRFLEYGISPATTITPTSHLYQHLLACAPLHALEIYALAAQHDMTALAKTASTHTLVHELSQITEELSKRMGSVYLLRLFQLHTSRTDTLKKLLVVDLGYHNSTDSCGIRNQRRLKEGWNLAVASILFTMKPDTTTTEIREAIVQHTSSIACPDCIKLRDTQLSRVVSEWALAKRTIST